MKRYSLLESLRARFSRRRDPDEPEFFYPGESTASVRDRGTADFRGVIEESLRAWRDDPLARRIVSLTTQFAVGRGFRVGADDSAADAVIREFWDHPLNRMDARIMEWSDELCRTGNLFVMLSSDPAGMTYVRAIPAANIEEIVPLPNDIEQPAAFRLRESVPLDAARFPEAKTVLPADAQAPCLEERMLHFAVNRPVGGQWGEPDLAPILIWLDRYRIWLEDRMRLNHYRSSFLFTVKAPRYSESMRRQRQLQLNSQPPTAGMILVTGADEEWDVISPRLESADANEDGAAIKKVIAAGAGIPMSFLAEAASASKAESGGMEDSACRNFRQRQQVLLFITETVLRHVIARAGRVRPGLPRDPDIHVYGENIAVPGMTEGGVAVKETGGGGEHQ